VVPPRRATFVPEQAGNYGHQRSSMGSTTGFGPGHVQVDPWLKRPSKQSVICSSMTLRDQYAAWVCGGRIVRLVPIFTCRRRGVDRVSTAPARAYASRCSTLCTWAGTRYAPGAVVPGPRCLRGPGAAPQAGIAVCSWQREVMPGFGKIGTGAADCPEGKVELLADLAVGQPLGGHPRDLQLLRRQLVPRPRRLAGARLP